MDPVATILAVLDKEIPRREALGYLRDWYKSGGFHPTLREIELAAKRYGFSLSSRWHIIAKNLGAIGETNPPARRPKVGQKTIYNGRTYKIVKVRPFGTIDVQDIVSKKYFRITGLGFV